MLVELFFQLQGRFEQHGIGYFQQNTPGLGARDRLPRADKALHLRMFKHRWLAALDQVKQLATLLSKSLQQWLAKQFAVIAVTRE